MNQNFEVTFEKYVRLIPNKAFGIEIKFARIVAQIGYIPLVEKEQSGFEFKVFSESRTPIHQLLFRRVNLDKPK